MNETNDEKVALDKHGSFSRVQLNSLLTADQRRLLEIAKIILFVCPPGFPGGLVVNAILVEITGLPERSVHTRFHCAEPDPNPRVRIVHLL